MAMALREERLPGLLTLRDISLVPSRMALGASMVYHGRGKLKAEARDEAAKFFEAVGIKPGRFWVLATGLTELLSGIALELGIATRLAALAVLVTQSVAVARVHARRGYDNTKQGFEFNLALMGISLGLLLAGPGKLSLHGRIEQRARGRGIRRLLWRARPNRFLRALLLLK